MWRPTGYGALAPRLWAAGDVQVYRAGVETMRVASGQVLFPDGLVTAPGMAFITEPRNGIRHSVGDSTLRYDLLGTNRGWISSGGNFSVSGDILAAGGFRHTVGPWLAVNIAAGYGPNPMPLSDNASSFNTPFRTQRAGSLIGVKIYQSEAIAAGSITVDVRKGGVSVVSFVLNGGAGFTDATYAKDTYACAATDSWTVYLSSDAGLAPLTVDLAVWLNLEE